MKRKFGAVALLVGVVIAAAGAASAALAGATATHAVIYHAFTSSGAPKIAITSKGRGHCNGGSAAIDRGDAWRCFSGNFVYDPCFSSRKAKGIVLCPVGPWTSSGVEIKLTDRLKGGNRAKPSTSGEPWAIETAAGTQCEFGTGASTLLDHLRANYYCATSKAVLWGYPSRKSEPWTIYSALPTATKLTNEVKIKTAWF